MKSGNSRLHAAILSALAVLPALSQAHAAPVNPALAGINTAEAPRVTRPVDANAVAVMERSHLAQFERATPIGNAPDSTPMEHMQLVLKRSASRQSALDTLIAAQHDRHSPKFHQWLKPEEFGEHFGVADADITAAKSWLVSQGFTVNGVYANKMQIDFSGNAGTVKRAFGVQEKQFKLGSESHVANVSDAHLPAALREVVAGVAGLNDLHPHAQHLPPMLGKFDPATQKLSLVKPGTNGGHSQAVPFFGGARGLVPYDLTKMYGVSKLHAAGITGHGTTIAVVEDGSMQPSDWTNFVAQFNLGHSGGTFAQVQPLPTGGGFNRTNCVNPDAPGAEDDGETLLDAEWSTAIAPGANIVVASCADVFSHNFFGGVFTAATNLINAPTRPDVISASYGYGEYFTDSGSKAAIDLMWAQADAEGISVFVSSGDSGSNPSFNGGTIQSVPAIDANSLGTSPNVTVVGGTDTADVLDGTTSKYFTSTLTTYYGSAKAYVPEIPWNQSCGNSTAAKSLGYANAIAFCNAQLAGDSEGFTIQSEAGSGGPSHFDTRPAWQNQVIGHSSDGMRDVPDVSLFAGSFNGYTWVITCTESYPCAPGFPGLIAISGGTSLASPMFAGIQALIDQGLAQQGLPQDQGNAAPVLYALAAQEYGSPGGSVPATLAGCNSDKGNNGTADCVFHNVTRGGISTQCIQQLPDTVTPDCFFYGTVPDYLFSGPAQVGLTSTSTSKYVSAYPSRPGWSFAAGLGSVNATNLLAAWQAYVSPAQ
ncbi:MAG TPA: S53 family peptidase [Xanthomonadaceae bacterium]|jgi:subtilase family serine protease